MKGFNFLRGREKERGERKSEWDNLGSETKFNGMQTGVVSSDVQRMQEQALRMQEMQAARERAMKAFDKSFDNANDAARRATERFKVR